jgi:hypothetical protein
MAKHPQPRPVEEGVDPSNEEIILDQIKVPAEKKPSPKEKSPRETEPKK